MHYLLGVLLFFLPVQAFAQDEYGGERPVDNRVIVGRDVTVAEDVSGDLIVVGATVSISGEVTGNVIAIGGYVTMEGQADAVYALGGNVNISGTVRESATVVSGIARVMTPLSYIRMWSIVADVSSEVQTLVSSGVVTIVNAPIQDANIVGQRLVWGSQASVDGSLSVPDSFRDAALTKVAPEQVTILPDHAASQSRSAIAHELILVMLSLGILAWLLLRVSPNLWHRGLLFVESHGFQVLGYGALLVFGLPVVSIVLLWTVYGAFVGSIVLLAWLMVSLLSQVIWVHWLGVRFLDRLSRTASPAVTVGVGVGVYGILLSLSTIGTVVFLLALVVGSGGFWMAIGKTYASSRKLKLL